MDNYATKLTLCITIIMHDYYLGYYYNTAFVYILDVIGYEHSYILKAIADKNPVIHTLKYARRYIDDLNIPNASRKLCDIITKEIYPEDLSIVATNDSKLNTTFLDLDNNMFICKLYDKRRDFPFKVVTFPNLKSNVPNGGS